MKRNLSGNIAVIIIALLIFPHITIWAKTGDWGLGFSEPGAKPIGNESADYLRPYDAFFIGEGDDKVIYLTFDAGYENGHTESILDTLKKNKVPATFFLVGTYIDKNPELVKRMVEEGHIIGNHTMKHPDMTAITDKEGFAKELSGVETIYKAVVGQEMHKYYRPPCGRYSEDNLKLAKELGYKTVFWSSAYRDFENDKQPSKEEAFSKLIPRIHPGAVLLLHSTSKTNAQILDEFISKCHEMGYKFKSLDQIKL